MRATTPPMAATRASGAAHHHVGQAVPVDAGSRAGAADGAGVGAGAAASGTGDALGAGEGALAVGSGVGVAVARAVTGAALGAAVGVARGVGRGEGVAVALGTGVGRTVGGGGAIVGTGSGADVLGRTTGFCASTGPCARWPVGVALGSGRLHVLADCAAAGAVADRMSAVVPAPAKMESLPLMVPSAFARCVVNRALMPPARSTSPRQAVAWQRSCADTSMEAWPKA